MTWNEQQTMISAAMAEFPPEFGLRGFPGNVFTISRAASYVNDAGEVQLYTYVRRMVTHKGDGNRRAEWMAFSKGTPAELRAEVTPSPRTAE